VSYRDIGYGRSGVSCLVVCSVTLGGGRGLHCAAVVLHVSDRRHCGLAVPASAGPYFALRFGQRFAKHRERGMNIQNHQMRPAGAKKRNKQTSVKTNPHEYLVIPFARAARTPCSKLRSRGGVPSAEGLGGVRSELEARGSSCCRTNGRTSCLSAFGSRISGSTSIITSLHSPKQSSLRHTFNLKARLGEHSPAESYFHSLIWNLT